MDLEKMGKYIQKDDENVLSTNGQSDNKEQRREKHQKEKQGHSRRSAQGYMQREKEATVTRYMARPRGSAVDRTSRTKRNTKQDLASGFITSEVRRMIVIRSVWAEGYKNTDKADDVRRCRKEAERIGPLRRSE